jgi:hypothetical protein
MNCQTLDQAILSFGWFWRQGMIDNLYIAFAHYIDRSGGRITVSLAGTVEK